MTTGPSGFTVLVFGGSDLPPNTTLSNGAFFPNGRDRNETFTWGRRVACVPADGSEISVGSKVDCQFDSSGGPQFSGWTTSGFAPPSRMSSPRPFIRKRQVWLRSQPHGQMRRARTTKRLPTQSCILVDDD
jgi:hypothetical protein